MTALFGTDGIRSQANVAPLRPEDAVAIGRALVEVVEARRGPGRPLIVVGRDTRRSGPMLEAALTAGALSSGLDVLSVGVLPTPGVARLTALRGAAAGVVISASHNPFEDNGVKLFGPDGGKAPEDWEAALTRVLAEASASLPRPVGVSLGAWRADRQAERDYADALCAAVPVDLSGLTLVLDCAHGAVWRLAPRVFRRLGARVSTLGVRPDGLNINRGVGALAPVDLQARVRRLGADLGLAFDGDGDRVIVVDARGRLLDGDHALALVARHLAAARRLKGGVVVTTVMANLGLDLALREVAVEVVRTPVGDRHVAGEMSRRGANVGGEQSGHLLFTDHAPTGDGLLSALVLLQVARAEGAPLDQLADVLTKCPQVLLSVPVVGRPPLEELSRFQARLGEVERRLGDEGRVVVRYSGTEPLLRVMLEGRDAPVLEALARELARLAVEDIEACR